MKRDMDLVRELLTWAQDAEVNAEFTTEGYVHFNAAVKGGYPTQDPWVKWDIGLDFEYFKKQFNAEAHAVIEIPPLDFTTGANILVSNKGLAACLYFKTFVGTWRPGAGAKWGHGPTLYLFGCDVKDYKVVIKHALSGDTVIGDIVPKASAAKVSGVDRMPTGGHGNSAGLVKYTGKSVAKAAQAGPKRFVPHIQDDSTRADCAAIKPIERLSERA